MATIDNPVGYIFDQGQKGIEERAAGQLAQYKFQEMREKARSEAAAKQGLASYLGADTPLGKLAGTDPKTAMQGVEMQGALAKAGQDKWKFDLEQRIYNVDQLSGMARAFADAPNPDIYNRFKQLHSQIDPQTVLPAYEVVAADPNKAIQAALSLEGASAQLKHQKSLYDMRGKPGEDVPFSSEVEAQRTRMDTAKAAAGRAASREFAPSETEKIVRYMNSLPPGPDRDAVKSILLRKADPTGEGASSGFGLAQLTQPMTKAELKTTQDQLRGLDGTLAAIKSFRDDIDEKGIKTFSFGEYNAADTGRQSTKYNLILSALKNAWEFGALQKAEFDYFSRLVPDPSSVVGTFKGKDAMLVQVDELANSISGTKNLLLNQVAGRGKGASQQQAGVAIPAQASGASVAGPAKPRQLTPEEKTELELMRSAQ